MSDKIAVLYIDDEPINLMNFSLIYEDKYTILTARSAGEAISILETRPVDIIFSDYRMPNMTGSEFFKSIHEKYSRIPKVMITGYLRNPEVEKIMDEGVLQKVIIKPYLEQDIDQVIAELVHP
jgi:response regulator RpfG family c-di-GMP phosphodiesterase